MQLTAGKTLATKFGLRYVHSIEEEEKKSLHGHKLRVHTNPNPTQPKSTNERIEEFIEHGRRFSGDQRSIREQIHRSSYTLLASILLFIADHAGRV
jgi:hypothetical protein